MLYSSYNHLQEGQILLVVFGVRGWGGGLGLKECWGGGCLVVKGGWEELFSPYFWAGEPDFAKAGRGHLGWKILSHRKVEFLPKKKTKQT